MTTALRRLAVAWGSAVTIGFTLAGVAHFVRAPSLWNAVRRYQDWYDPFNAAKDLALFLLLVPAFLAFGASARLTKRSSMHPATPSRSFALMRWIVLVPVAVVLTCVSYVLAASSLLMFWEGDRLASGSVGGPWWNSFLSVAAFLPAGGTFVAMGCSIAPNAKRSVAILSTGAIVLSAAVYVLFGFALRSRPLLWPSIAGTSLVAGAIVACAVVWREESKQSAQPTNIDSNANTEVDVMP